jgi:hypothetical protein
MNNAQKAQDDVIRQNILQSIKREQSISLVEKMAIKNVRFMLVWNFKDEEKTQQALRRHQLAVKEGRSRKLILMAFQHQVLPEYTILALTTPPLDHEISGFGFNPVKKDKANWQPIQYKNRKGKEHLNSRDGDYSHTSNYYYMDKQDVVDFLTMSEQIEMLYK